MVKVAKKVKEPMSDTELIKECVLLYEETFEKILKHFEKIAFTPGRIKVSRFKVDELEAMLNGDFSDTKYLEPSAEEIAKAKEEFEEFKLLLTENLYFSGDLFYQVLRYKTIDLNYPSFEVFVKTQEAKKKITDLLLKNKKWVQFKNPALTQMYFKVPTIAAGVLFNLSISGPPDKVILDSDKVLSLTWNWYDVLIGDVHISEDLKNRNLWFNLDHITEKYTFAWLSRQLQVLECGFHAEQENIESAMWKIHDRILAQQMREPQRGTDPLPLPRGIVRRTPARRIDLLEQRATVLPELTAARIAGLYRGYTGNGIQTNAAIPQAQALPDANQVYLQRDDLTWATEAPPGGLNDDLEIFN